MDSYESPVSSECKGKTPESSPVPKMSNKGDNKGQTLLEVLSDLGLKNHHKGKFTISTVLEINGNTVSDEPVKHLEQLPLSFLKKLMMSNLKARNIHCEDESENVQCSLQAFCDGIETSDNSIHPLDLIVALFHCSDPFLQQDMVTKMALCQFAVPLLLPYCDSQQSTLMLWAMRDIVKKFRPHYLAEEYRTFQEGRVVEIDIPMMSFVKLGESDLPKSKILNKLFGNPTQHNDMFVHCDMECGDVPKKISNGLVEISWYLPSGNPKIDVFTQPMAIANLRGDGKFFKTQMSFLCQTSVAVFIFSDNLEGDMSILNNTELFLVTSSKNFTERTLLDKCKKCNIKEENIIIKHKQNDAQFLKAFQRHVSDLIHNNQKKTKVENMAVVARKEGILVDEDESDCMNGRQIAELITKGITDVVKFKETQLLLHGNIWKEISYLEKEKCRLRKTNRELSLEHYKSSLIAKENQLREQQRQKGISHTMASFISGISLSGPERLYFLKWLKIQLDTLCRRDLTSLTQQYQKCCSDTPHNKKKISLLDEQILKCSLGLEHFFRELGQLYESVCSLPKNVPARNTFQDLPDICAQMLLGGFPVELIDGDVSNIPMRWISDVINQLHKLMENKSRMLVLTVLGVQSTGKSTLLNTMFGVQFAVSSGRCTRGAFMQLIKVSEDFRSELKCDYIMVIDTEGLKSPQLAELNTSYEHDNELATLVIGLSDITIINIAMENSTEMKDILQIVVHAFLRMKEVGKKPRCLFVHQNVADMSAHDSNMRDRKKLMEQLDEMTQAAARMERKEDDIKFTDVMEFDAEKDSYYIPGLWHGTPPMAPMNAGYSEAVYDLKKSLICSLQTSGITRNDATEFLKWTESLWKAVKFENFIFNFRNSLVADAYTELCTLYNSWAWSFQSDMNKWLITKETMITNFGVTEKNIQISFLRAMMKDMLSEASMTLHEEEQKIFSNLDKYFKRNDNKVNLVERHREEFRNSARCLKRETESSIKQSLEQIVDIREGMEKVNAIKARQNDTIEKKVRELLKDCRDRQERLSDDDLTTEFEKMWREIMAELHDVRLPEKNVYKDVHYVLMTNLSAKSGHVAEKVTSVDLRSCDKGKFICKSDWFSGSHRQGILNVIKHIYINNCITEMQHICDEIIGHCNLQGFYHAQAMERNNTDYRDTYIKDILMYVDDQIKKHHISDECETYLKIHICGRAAKRFQKAHWEFNVRNDPLKRLMTSKGIFLERFIELFSEKDQCQQKAGQFTETCVKPAVQAYVSQHLGQAIADEMKTGDGGLNYNTRTHFQFAILKQMLHECSFQRYTEYTGSYENFVKMWIKKQIVQKMLGGQMTILEKNLLSEIVKEIIETINSTSKDTDLEVFIQQFCSDLKDKLVFPRDALDTFLILINVKTDEFAINLLEFVKQMEKTLAQGYENQTGITDRITELPCKPHELLFARLCGCGKQCPFCGTPCEAGSLEHNVHFANMHQPQAFGQSVWNDSNKLVINICTTTVTSNVEFKSDATNGKFYKFKNYREIYPEWQIAGDSSTKASDYWKYVLMKFNTEFAKSYNANPADIPEDWERLTADDALRSLKKSFNMQITNMEV